MMFSKEIQEQIQKMFLNRKHHNIKDVCSNLQREENGATYLYLSIRFEGLREPVRASELHALKSILGMDFSIMRIESGFDWFMLCLRLE